MTRLNYYPFLNLVSIVSHAFLRPTWCILEDKKSYRKTYSTVRSLIWVWINWMTGLIDEESHFRMKIILEQASFGSWFPSLCSGMFPERFRSVSVPVGSKENRLVFPKGGTLTCWFLGTHFSDSAFNLFKNLCDIILVNSRNRRVPWPAFPWMFLLCFSCNGFKLATAFVSQGCHLLMGKSSIVVKLKIVVIFNLLVKLRV